MDKNAIHNIAANYCHMYGQDENKCLDELKQLVVKHYLRQYEIFTYICNNAPNTTVEMHDRFFYITTDAEQNKELVEDLSTKFFITNIIAWKEVDQVSSHGFKQSNLFRKIKIWK